MDWKEVNNKLFIAATVLGAFLLALVISTPIIVEKTTDRVIQELRSGRYSPGPYAPGFDPDEIEPSVFNPPQKIQAQPPQQSNWNADWEKQRMD